MTDLTDALAEALHNLPIAFYDYTAADELVEDIVAALPPTITDALALGQAWAAVEAALPEGWTFRGVQPIREDLWHALALAPDGEVTCNLGVKHREFDKASCTGPTPTAALEALAARLTEVTP